MRATAGRPGRRRGRHVPRATPARAARWPFRVGAVVDARRASGPHGAHRHPRRGRHARRARSPPSPWRGSWTRSTPSSRAPAEPLGLVLAAIVIFAVGAHRRPPRGVGPGQDRRHGAGRERSWSCFGVTHPVSCASRSSTWSVLSPDLLRPGHGAVGGRAWPTPSTSSTASTAWPPASWPSPRARSSSTASSWATPGSLGPGQHRPAHRRHHPRHLPRLPAPQLPPGARSSWATAARCCSAC